jgi:hypothetical protein
MIQVNLSQYDALDHAVETSQFREHVRCLWLHAERHLTKEQHADIVSFTFRDAYLSQAEYEENIGDEEDGKPKSYAQNSHHNAARLSNDDVIAIPSFPRPQIPGHEAVTVTRIMK